MSGRRTYPRFPTMLRSSSRVNSASATEESAKKTSSSGFSVAASRMSPKPGWRQRISSMRARATCSAARCLLGARCSSASACEPAGSNQCRGGPEPFVSSPLHSRHQVCRSNQSAHCLRNGRNHTSASYIAHACCHQRVLSIITQNTNT